jgi:hypothetical protein
VVPLGTYGRSRALALSPSRKTIQATGAAAPAFAYGQIVDSGASSSLTALPYEPPALAELGLVVDETLHGCYWGKQFGGTDGFTFMGISVPISACSS